MKYLVTILFLSFYSGQEKQEINQHTEAVLKAWIKTQNEGTDKAIIAFIDDYYAPEVLKKMKNKEDHLKFYRQVIDEFGALQEIVYEVMHATDTSLKVQLLKVGTTLTPTPTPEEILVVEIDLDPKNKKKMVSALGMGALICYIKR